MKPAFVLLLAFFTLSSISKPASAQQKSTGTLTGSVIGPDDQPLAYATVTLSKASDSSLVKGALTDESGAYQFTGIPYGTYQITVTMIGMQKATSPQLKLQAESLQVSTLSLKANPQTLKGVQVNATKPFIQHKPGQTVVNVENSSVSAGNSVMEVLEKSPGILVDQDDNISLNGKNGVNILINGRPTHLSSKQLGTMLKGMPASSVSHIELMTQPPAQYSAEGTAGLINIVLKKNTALGVNGSLTAGVGYGQYLKYNAGGSLNYRNKSFSLYGNYNFDHRKDKFGMDITRDFYLPDTKDLQTSLTQESTMKVGGENHTAQLGMDFFLSPRQTLGFVANGTFNSGDFNSHSPVHFLSPEGTTDSISSSDNHTGYDWNNEGANVHYTLNLDDKGSAISANVDYNRFYQSMPQSIVTQVTDGSGNSLRDPQKRKGEQPNEINIYAAKVDYNGSFKNGFALDAGLKSSYVHTDNNSLFQRYQDGQWTNDPQNTNHFIYKENVNAAYVSLAKKFNKGWSAKAGVRGEQTTIHTEQRTTDSLNKDDYFELFPNVSVSKTFNPNHSLSLSYSRRIDRPSYQNLNPFVYYVDEYTYRVGNPYLQPQFVRSVELAYTFKQRYTAVLSYSHTSDIMAMVLKQVDSTHTTIQTQDNISKLDNVTLNLGLPVAITPWWQTYNSIMVFYNRYDGVYNGYPLNKGYTTFMINTHQSFILPHSWKAELTGMFRSKTILGPLVAEPMGMVSAGITKSFWDDKASLKLNVQDIFQTLNLKGGVDFGNLHATTLFHANRRAANLTFTWNFGNQKVKVKKHEKTAIQEEESRIKKGNGSTQ